MDASSVKSFSAEGPVVRVAKALVSMLKFDSWPRISLIVTGSSMSPKLH